MSPIKLEVARPSAEIDSMLESEIKSREPQTEEGKAWHDFGQIFKQNPPEINLDQIQQFDEETEKFTEFLKKLINYQEDTTKLMSEIQKITNILCPDELSNNGQPPKPLREKLISLLEQVL